MSILNFITIEYSYFVSIKPSLSLCLSVPPPPSLPHTHTHTHTHENIAKEMNNECKSVLIMTYFRCKRYDLYYLSFRLQRISISFVRTASPPPPPPQFSSRWYLCVQESPYSLHPASQKLPQRCLWNSFSVRFTKHRKVQTNAYLRRTHSMHMFGGHPLFRTLAVILFQICFPFKEDHRGFPHADSKWNPHWQTRVCAPFSLCQQSR